jgi:formate hydrogenlyase transcriptional activator
MAESLAVPKDSLTVGTARRTAEFIYQALPVLLVCLGYYAGAWVAKELRFPDSHLSLIWPPTAILLAALLLAPLRKWWIYLLAVAPVHVLVQWQDGVATGGIISQLIGNFGQALLAACSVLYFNKGVTHLNSFRAMVVFTFGAIILAPVVVSTIAAYLYVLSGWEQNYWYAWRARVLSNSLSTLMIVPPIILLSSRGATTKPTSVKPQRYVEASALIILLILTSSVSFGKEVEDLLGVACPIILPLPVLLWSASRFGLGGLCYSTLLVAYFAFESTAAGLGFFAMSSPAENILSVQFYLIVTTLPLMLLAGLIQERQEKEQTLRENEARYRALVTASAETVWQANAWGDGFFVTPSWQQLAGQDANQMREFGWLEAVHPDDREQAGQLWRRAMLEKRAYENELRVRARDGNYRHFYVHAVPILTPNGNVHEWVGANVDITERKQAEQALQDLVAGTGVIGEEFFPAYVRHVAAALDVYCATVAEVTDGQNSRLRTLAVWVDQRCERNYEYDVVDAPCGQVLREGRLFCCRESVQERFPECRSLGDLNAVSYMGAPLFNSVGQLIGNLCIIDNKPIEDERRAKSILEIFAARAAAEIERKRGEETLRESEQALRDSEERLRLALKSGRMGVWDWDRRTNVRKWSKEYFLIMGLLPFSVEPSDQVWANCVHPEDVPHAQAAVEAAVAEKREYRFEYRIIWPDGTVRWVVARGEPIYDQDGQCVRIMGVLVDITERKLAEEEIRRLKERLEAENVYLRNEVSGAYRDRELVGRSEAILKVLQQVNQVTGTDMTVLVLGETGTGKELVARAIHAKSMRREKPLVKVNCSALPGELIESELFGHERGAFTGATGRQVGRFELADGGTIFLDEVGDLPVSLQAKLLRVLQEGEFERLGSGKTIKVDVRVIAATNRDLLQAVQNERFRVDLYYRLNVYPIRLPPLRERREDIGLLAGVFLRETSRRLGRVFDPISAEVLEALREYDWLGNVRELQNVIERAAVISTGRRLQLPEGWGVSLAVSIRRTKEMMEVRRHAIGLPPREATLEELERNHILQILQQTRGRVEGPKGAAAILGLNPSTLRSRMHKLGIRKTDRFLAEPRYSVD